MDKQRITWRSFVDAGHAGAGPIATKWNLSATPTLYVIDHKGVIRYKWAGAPGEKVIEAALDKLIKVAEESGEQSSEPSGDDWPAEPVAAPAYFGCGGTLGVSRAAIETWRIAVDGA
jgi:hypothetical protein